jgi:Na+/H+ antiporter NhaA
VRVLIRGIVMRVLNFLITTSIFSSLFIGLALASAIMTSTVHAQLAPRSVSAITIPD